MEGNHVSNIYKVSFGEAKIKIELPASAMVQILEMEEHQPVTDLHNLVREALINPIGSKRLKDLVKERSKICIIVPDRTRKLPVEVILKGILSELSLVNVKNEDITILFALGTHRRMTEVEMRAVVGDKIYNRYQCLNHNWADEQSLVSLGKTSQGTPISVNRLVYDADLRIAIGGVNPHRVAGWSGGAKAIQPGVCGADTTGATHWLGATIPIEKIYGIVENPVRHEMEAVASQVGLEFIVNCVINKHYQPVAVYAGNYVETHRRCVEVAKKVYAVNLQEEKDIVICGTGPYATDMWNVGCGPSELVVKPGGSVVVLAPCPDGVSSTHPEIIKFGYRRPLAEVKRLVETARIKDLSAAAHLIHAGSVLSRKGARCVLVSKGVSASEAKMLGIEYAATAQEAIDSVFSDHSSVKVGIYPGDSPTSLYFLK
jgi:nickel-dependent lactate racemase